MSLERVNLLRNEKSPYLLQHKDNPIAWMPWGPEAFALAKEEKKPVFFVCRLFDLSLVSCDGSRVL